MPSLKADHVAAMQTALQARQVCKEQTAWPRKDYLREASEPGFALLCPSSSLGSLQTKAAAALCSVTMEL